MRSTNGNERVNHRPRLQRHEENRLRLVVVDHWNVAPVRVAGFAYKRKAHAADLTYAFPVSFEFSAQTS